MEGHHLIPGDLIRLETSEVSTIRETASLISSAFPGTHSNIIYHLDSKNLTFTFSQEVYDEDENGQGRHINVAFTFNLEKLKE